MHPTIRYWTQRVAECDYMLNKEILSVEDQATWTGKLYLAEAALAQWKSELEVEA
tara:strand:+ start:631 stop:795 length:165 start_codon:yes stop_codon:yes gene_type:complete